VGRGGEGWGGVGRGGALGFPPQNYDVIITSTATIGYTTQ